MKLFNFLFGKKSKIEPIDLQQKKSWQDYTYITDYFKEKYIYPESDSYYEWKEKYDIAVENNDLDEINLLTKGKDIHNDTVAILNFIDFFTLNDGSLDRTEIFNQKMNELISQGYVEKVSILDNDRIIIKTKDGDIKVKKLSKVVDLEDKTIETMQRKKRCHTESVKLSYQLSNKNNVCTGWVYNLSSFAKYLHSWVEVTDSKDNDWCLDFTFNSAMDRDSYYRLFNVGQLSKVPSAIIQQEFDTILDMFGMDGIFLKAYLCNREETLEIYNKEKKARVNGKISPLSRI